MAPPRIYTDEERVERKRQQSREYAIRNREAWKKASLAYYHAHKDELNRRKREKSAAAKLANVPVASTVYYNTHKDELNRKKREKRAAAKLVKAQQPQQPQVNLVRTSSLVPCRV